MPTHIKQKSCPCGKGDYCTNGLKCTEQNCFLLKSSTVVHRPMAIPIDSLNPILVLRDNGRIRSSVERREFPYGQHIPERRSGEDHRSREDKRHKSRVSQYNMNYKDYSPWN
jgi:hypothetical protein